MISYKTLKEQADEWHISLRHLQYLCKQGRIEGAIKKAGAWFVPDNAPMPAQYTKFRNGHVHFVGTKKRIFCHAIALFRQRGFEAVSMKDIADAVGITQSSVYNHFKSKQQILDAGYEFYRYYFLSDRPTVESIEPILHEGSLVDIVKSANFLFREDHYEQMADITTIIFHRCAIDMAAKELASSLVIEEGINFVQSILDRAVEIGRLAPLDTRAVSMLINSTRIFLLHCWLSRVSDEAYAQFDLGEVKMCQVIAAALTDLKFPQGYCGNLQSE